MAGTITGDGPEEQDVEKSSEDEMQQHDWQASRDEEERNKG